MSGVLKTVGKVFKKIVQSPIFKVIAIAAAVYFTGGLALGAMGSGFAAALPGVAGLADAVGLGTTGAFATVGVDAATISADAVIGFGESAATDAADAAATAGGAALDTAGADAGASLDAATGANAGIDTAGADAGASLDAATGANAPALDAGGAPLDTSGADAGSSLDSATGANGAPSGSDAGSALDNSNAAGSSSPGASPSTTTTAPANSQPPPSSNSGSALKNVSDWAKANPTMAQILGKAASTAGSSVVNALSANAQMSQQEHQYEQTRQDIINRGGVPDETAAWKPQTYKTPGVVNAALNASTTKKG